MKKLWLVASPIACAIFFAASACGGDDDKSTASTTSGASVTASSRTATSAATATDTPDTGDGTGDSDYYNQVADLLDQADQETADIGQQYGGPYSDAADEIDQTGTAFTRTGEVFETLLLALSDLGPPTEAEDAQQAYFNSVQAAAVLFADALSALENVTTDAELATFKNQYGPQLSAASADIEDTCLVLQDLADSAGSGADLGCTVQN